MKFSRILIAVDDSPIALSAAAAGAALAAGLEGAELALVSVADTRSEAVVQGGPPLRRMLREEAQGALAAAARAAMGRPPARTFLREGAPGPEVCAAAREWPADLIVIGTHGRGGLTRLLLGSTAEAVVRHAPCAVLVVPASASGATRAGDAPAAPRSGP